MKNLEATITQAGVRLQDVVSVTCYLRDLDHWPVLNEIYSDYFDHEAPARAAVAVNDSRPAPTSKSPASHGARTQAGRRTTSPKAIASPAQSADGRALEVVCVAQQVPQVRHRLDTAVL
jgi:hypothetical protein